MVTKAKTFSAALRKAVERMASPLGALSSVSTIIMMLAITIDVLARNIGGEPIPGLLELSETALVATVFLGISYAGVTNAHVSVDLLTSKMPLRPARYLSGLMWLLGAGMVLWFIIATAERAIQSTQMGEVTLGLLVWPVWPTRWLIVFGYTAFLIVALANAYLSLRNESLLGEEEDSIIPPAHAANGSGDQPNAPDNNETEKYS